MHDENSMFNGVVGLTVFMAGAVLGVTLLMAGAETPIGVELLQKASNLTGVNPRYLLWTICGLIVTGFVVIPPILAFSDVDRGGSSLGRIGIVATPILLALIALAVLWGW